MIETKKTVSELRKETGGKAMIGSEYQTKSGKTVKIFNIGKAKDGRAMVRVGFYAGVSGWNGYDKTHWDSHRWLSESKLEVD